MSCCQRVGVGVIVNSCRTCENCVAGEEQYCLNGAVETYNSIDRDGTPTQGGYSAQIVTDEDFVLGLLRATGVLCVYGSGFCTAPEDGFFRVVYLAPPAELSEIYALIADFTREFLSRRPRSVTTAPPTQNPPHPWPAGPPRPSAPGGPGVLLTALP